jgi:RNA polymerase sigma factor (sigma-70 family)
MSFVPDETLLERCRDGDSAAWEALVRRHRRLVWSVLVKHRLREEEREDIFQQVFAALVEHLDGVRDGKALPAWLATTARRLCWRAAQRARSARENHGTRELVAAAPSSTAPCTVRGNVRSLASIAAPAWVFFHTRLNPASASAIRDARARSFAPRGSTSRKPRPAGGTDRAPSTA